MAHPLSCKRIGVNKKNDNLPEQQHFGQMSAHLGRAREQMLERSGYGSFGGFEEDFHGGFGRDGKFFGRGRR